MCISWALTPTHLSCYQNLSARSTDFCSARFGKIYGPLSSVGKYDSALNLGLLFHLSRAKLIGSVWVRQVREQNGRQTMSVSKITPLNGLDELITELSLLVYFIKFSFFLF